MSSITLTDTSSNHRIFVTANMVIQMFNTVQSPFFTYSSNYYIFDLNYSCLGCANCSTGYILDTATSTCMPTNSTINSTLNGTITVTNGSTSINNISTATNSSNSTTNLTNSINSTANTTTNLTNLSSKSMSANYSNSKSSPQSQHSSSSINNDIFSFFQQLSSYDNMQLSHFMSSMMIISSIKFSPQFLLSFSLFIDDISYYSYHSYIYPNSVRYFFQKSFVFLKDKLNPWLLKAMQLLSRPTDYALTNNNRNIQLLSIATLTNQQVFFTRSFVENYRNNFIFTISIFLFLYIVRLLINVLQYCGCNLSKANSFIIRNTRWWVLYASIVQGSISRICFDFGVQLQQPGLQTALDGFNLIITYIVGFIILAQILILYALIYYWASRKEAKVMLMPCRYSSFSFVLQPIIIVGRTCIRSFLHSFLLTSYCNQILMLTIVDFSFVILCFKMRALFYNHTIFAFYFIYMISFAVFDLFFLLQQSRILSSLQVMRQLFGVTILGCIISASIFIFLVFTYLFLRVTLRAIFRYLFAEPPRLKIVPQSQFTKKCAQRTEQNPNHQKLQKIQKIDNNFAKWLEHGKTHSNTKQQNLSTPVLLCGKVKNRNKIQQKQQRKVKFRLHKLSNMKLLQNAQ